MVKVVRMHAVGGPEVLRVDDLPARTPKPHEVRIRTAAIGLNRVETMYRSGGFGMPVLPATIGYEAAGAIEAIGSDVTTFSVGDRVATIPGLSMEDYGVYAESFLYPENMLIPLNDEQSLEDAAATWMAFLTAYALAEPRSIKTGDAVVLTAASSSVGLAAIQIARAEGAIPIAVTRTRDKAEALQRLGAAHVIVSHEDDVTARILELTNGAGAQFAFDAVAGAMIPTLASAMAPGGEIIVYGALGGGEAAMPVHMMMLNGLVVRGFATNQITLSPPRLYDAIDYIRNGLAKRQFKPVIDKRFSLDQIVDAHRYLESNAQLGKVIVTTL